MKKIDIYKKALTVGVMYDVFTCTRRPESVKIKLLSKRAICNVSDAKSNFYGALYYASYKGELTCLYLEQDQDVFKIKGGIFDQFLDEVTGVSHETLKKVAKKYNIIYKP
jgi:hypothetical protein